MKSTGIILLFASLSVFTSNADAQMTFDEVSQKQMALTNLSSMPLAFTENQGQFGDKTLFRAQSGGPTFYFCRDEVAYLFVRDTDELLEDDLGAMPGMPDRFDRPRYKKEALLIKARFVSANPNPEVVGEERFSHNCNYFYRNDPSKWRTDVPNYSAVLYRDIWPEIDLPYHGDGRGMKYDFIVNPGADLAQIQIRYEGIEDLSVSNAGDLDCQTAFGPIHEKAPYIYQEIGGQKRKVSGRYMLRGKNAFGFVLDEPCNPAYPLVIDPELIYSTYLGGGNNDRGYAIAVDPSGNAYVTGYRLSIDFPTGTRIRQTMFKAICFR